MLSSSESITKALPEVEALLFDVFGTVVDWLGGITGELFLIAQQHGIKSLDLARCSEFARQWRQGYLTITRQVASGEDGPLNVDVMHRQILDEMIASPKWESFGNILDDAACQRLTLVWHRLDGWSDSSPGLHALRKKRIIGTLSNGHVKLLVNMAKHADLPWDVVFSGEMWATYKPDPKIYLGAAAYLSLEPSKCALVASHIQDLRAAASLGYKTIYVRRSTEDHGGNVRNSVKSKTDEGEVDLVVDSLLELADVLR